MDDLLNALYGVNDFAKEANKTYQEIKNGANNPQAAEQSAQMNAGNGIANWTQPAVIVGIIGVGVAILGLIFFRK
jgi:hypothetical protein